MKRSIWWCCCITSSYFEPSVTSYLSHRLLQRFQLAPGIACVISDLTHSIYSWATLNMLHLVVRACRKKLCAICIKIYRLRNVGPINIFGPRISSEISIFITFKFIAIFWTTENPFWKFVPIFFANWLDRQIKCMLFFYSNQASNIVIIAN